MVTLITIVLAGVLVSIGMAGYARVQKWCFYGGLVGFAIIVILLLVTSRAHFIASFNLQANKLFGIPNAYQATNAAAVKSGYIAPAISFGPLGPTMLLVPMMMFYLLWPNWGTTLYGEIRGASDFRRVFTGMFAGLWTTVLLSVVFLLLFAKAFGWAFYQNVNAQWIGAGKAALPIFPYPVMMAGWVVNNAAFQVILLLLMSLWFFGWVGTLFLSSTRVIFAAAFDRVLPGRGRAGLGEAPGADRLAGADAAARGRPGCAVRVQQHVRELHAGRHAGHRGDLPVQRDRRGDPAAAQAGPVVRLAGQQDQGAWRAGRAGGRGGHDRAAGVQPRTSGCRTPPTASTTAARSSTWARCTCSLSVSTWALASSATARASTCP